MSNADQLDIAVAVESVYGTSPAGTWPRMRITSESLAETANFVESNELSPTRQVKDVIRTGTEAGGNVDFELSYGGANSAFDTLLLALFFSAGWSTAVNNTGTYSTVAATNTVSGTGCATSLALNQWVRLAGFSAAVDGYYKVATIVDADSFTTVQSITADSTGGGDESVNMGSQLVNGVTATSVAIEREFTDNTNDFAIDVGLGLQQMSLQTAIDAILSGQFQFLGKAETSETSGTAAGYTAAPTNSVMNTVDHVLAVFEDGSTVDITELSLQLANNLRARKAVANRGPISLGAGKFKVTGSIDGYYDGPTRVNKFLNGAATSFGLIFDDSGGVVGNAYILDFPQARLTSATRNATGTNSDVMSPANFQAYEDPTEGITARIVRFAAL